MDDDTLEQRILRKSEEFSDRINNKKRLITQHKKYNVLRKILIYLMILSPLWLPILFTSIGASFGCCKRNDLGLWFFGAGPVILSFFIGIWGLCKFKANIGLIVFYAFVSIFLLFFIGWGSLLNLGAGP